MLWAMAKRVAISVLWYLAVGWGLNFLAFYFAFPALAVYLIAFATAMFVGIDPAGLFWARRANAPSTGSALRGASTADMTKAATPS
jgi:hypothetical protein